MRSFGADAIRVKGNYEDSKECIKQSENNWQIVQDVVWEDYKLVPPPTMEIFCNDERSF